MDFHKRLLQIKEGEENCINHLDNNDKFYQNLTDEVKESVRRYHRTRILLLEELLDEMR